MSEKDCKMAIDDTANRIALVFPDYPDLGTKFKAHCIEEEYNELEVLIDDVQDGFDESQVMETLSEETNIQDDDKETICTVIHNTLINFRRTPSTLNLKDIQINIDNDEKQLDSVKQLVKQQAHLLSPDNINEDKSLLNVLLIGSQNSFPLLIYLADTYVRWRLNKYHKCYAELHKYDLQNQRQQFIGEYFKHFNIQDFFNECYIIKQLKKEKDNVILSSILLWYEHSISSFYRRITAPLTIHPQQIQYVINDSLIIYVKYSIALLYTINNIIKNPTTKLPLQIDFWIIPKSMSTNMQYHCDEDSDNDDDNDEKDDDNNDKKKQCNLKDFTNRLKYTNNLAEANINIKEIYNLSRVFVGVYGKVVDNKRNKRMVMLVDRRINKENIIENNKNYSKINMEDEKKNVDKLYAFLPKNSQNIPNGKYLHESMFNLTRMEILPSENGIVDEGKGNTIHSNTDILNMFLLSIHIHSVNNIRAYWYVNGTVTRFFVNDMINIWPLFFIQKCMDKENGVAILQDIKPIIRFVNDNNTNIPLKDANFDTFFKENTNINPVDAYAKPISQNNVQKT